MYFTSPRKCVCLLFALVLATGTAAAQSRPKHCVTDTGKEIRTDRPCAAFDGQEQRSDGNAQSSAADRRLSAARASSYRPICAKTIEDLSYTLSAALDARDVNRFSSVYHWVGVSNVRALAVLNKFEKMMTRPVVDIEMTGGSSGGVSWSEDAEGYLLPVEHSPRPPSGLRVRQMKAGVNATESTKFRIVKHFGCYWLSM